MAEHLTFLYRDGGLLLAQSKQDEEEHQRDEDLKREHPLKHKTKKNIIVMDMGEDYGNKK